MFKKIIILVLLSSNAYAIDFVFDIPHTIQSTFSVASDFAQEASATVIQNQQVQTAIQTAKTVQEAIRIYNQAVRQYESTIGNFGYGSLIDRIQDRNVRAYMPKSWNDTLDAVNGAKNSIEGTYSRLKNVSDAFNNGQVPYLKNVVYIDPKIKAAKHYGETFKANKTYAVIAETSLNQTQDRIDSTQRLMNTIEHAATPNKKDDLRNTLLAENAMLQQENIRLSALSLKRMNDNNIDEMQRRAEDVKMLQRPINYTW